MPFLSTNEPGVRPRILVINPNSTQAFSIAMQDTLPADAIPLDFYTAPSDTSPASIEGTTDSILSAAAVIRDLSADLSKWDGFVIACFSAHPLVPALRELTSAPVVGILEPPLLLASQLSSSVGILTTSPRWVPLLTHDIAGLGLARQCTGGVVSSGMSVLDLEHLPREEVLSRLGKIGREELVEKRGVGVVVLGCAGMVGLKGVVEKACGEGVRVLDPVECGVEVCRGLVRLGAETSKVGMYAAA